MKHFAELTEEQRELLSAELLRRAAVLYEQGGDLPQAAQAWLEAAHYPQALALYQRWESQLLEGNIVARVQALLGQAASHHLGAVSHKPAGEHPCSREAGQHAYQQARALLATLSRQDPSRWSQGWAALGDYGALLDRYDLLQEGYEQALQVWEGSISSREHEPEGICQAYLTAARTRGDRLLCQALEERLATWEMDEADAPRKPTLLPFPVDKLTLLHTLIGHTTQVNSVAISSDSRIMASGSSDRTIKLWDLSSGQLLRTLTLTRNISFVYSVAFSPNNRTLVSGSWDNAINVWELPAGNLLRTLTGHTKYVDCVAISPDNRTLVSGSWDHTVKIWDLSSGQLLHTLTDHTSPVKSVAISPDNQTLVSGSEDSTIKIWQLSTGNLVRTLTGHTSFVWSVVISPNSQTLVSGSYEIKIWELSTGRLLQTMSEYSGAARLAISSDGQTLVSGGGDNMIRIWELPTGRLLRTLSDHTSQVSGVAISPDNQTLVSGSHDHTIKVWGMKPV